MPKGITEGSGVQEQNRQQDYITINEQLLSNKPAMGLFTTDCCRPVSRSLLKLVISGY